MSDIDIIDGVPTAAQYASFRAHAGWPQVSPDHVERGLANSLASVLARARDGEVVGIGRVVGDGGVYLYLQDIIVRERWRGRGIGSRITEELLGRARELGGPGTFVGLMAAAGAAPFYERFGFAARNDDRPGMWLTL